MSAAVSDEEAEQLRAPVAGQLDLNDEPIRVGGLFEGYGGLTQAARAVFGGELAWVSEYGPPSKATPRPTQAAARLLAHRHPDVPNLGDITQIDWANLTWVEIFCLGFPCQDVSSAGKRVGMKPDSRSGLWEHAARGIAVLRPSLVLIENVRGLLSAEAACDVEPCPWCLGDQRERPLRALGAVLGDLAALGYDAQWTCVGADAVGAPHQRARVFILAWPAGADPTELGRRPAGRDDRVRAAGLVAEPADANRSGRQGAESAAGRDLSARGAAGDATVLGRDDAAAAQPGGDREPAGAARGPGGAAADPDRVEPERRRVGGVVDGSPGSEPREGLLRERAGDAVGDGGPDALEWGDYAPAIARWERVLDRPAPVPTQTGKRGGQQLSPRFVEWLMGLPEGWVTDVPDLTRNEQLKLLGNGVVPQQAEYALRLLLAQLTAAQPVAA